MIEEYIEEVANSNRSINLQAVSFESISDSQSLFSLYYVMLPTCNYLVRRGDSSNSDQFVLIYISAPSKTCSSVSSILRSAFGM